MTTAKKVTPIRASITKENAARSMPKRWTDKSRALYVQYCNADQRANVKKTSAFDSMYADGIRSTDFLAPSNELSTSTDELYADLVKVKVESWGNTAAQLYYMTTAEAKKLPEAKKAKRTKLRADIGAYLGADRKAFKTREDLAAGKGKGKGKTGAKQPSMPKTGDKVIDEANALAMKAIKKETDLQNWCINNLPEDTALKISQLRSKIVAILQPEPTH